MRPRITVSRDVRSFHLRALVGLCLIAGMAFSAPPVAAAGSGEIIKSQSDTREYRALLLDNGLKVVLVSDPQTDIAAASLSVDIGSGANPTERAGLAHFLEHMLFLGTEKYPEPGEYKDFMSRHGGSDNAYTAFDETNYFFQIEAGFLEPALDRFAQFFIAPRFNPEYVDRERQVVHSEYLGKRTDDRRRSYAAAQAMMNPQHPSARFAVGNLETLADRPNSDVRDELLAFYQRYYSANLMALSVVGRESLDDLERWVRDRFTQIENRNASALSIDVPLYAAGALPARLNVTPERESFSVSFAFPMRSIRKHWRAKPGTHVSHLLGHEGKTSLLAELKRRGWAQGLSAGTSDHENGATVNIHIQLTPQGSEHIDDIAALLFQTVSIIKLDGVKKWLFDENAQLAEIDFRFSEKPSPTSLARRLASMQHEIPQQQLLRAPYAYDEWRADLITQILDAMRPDNVLITHVAPGLNTDSKAQWYDTPYSVTHLDKAATDVWLGAKPSQALAIPAPNPFIPTRLKMHTGAVSDIPRPLMAKPGFHVWHAQQDQFALPKADFFISLRSPHANDTPRHSLLTRLYVALINDQLDTFTYAADLAGLSFNLYPHSRGLSLRISGYDDRQAILLERILLALTAGEIDPQRFAILKEAATRGLENARRNQPYRRAMGHLRSLLLNPSWTRVERLAVIDTLTLKQLEEHIKVLLSSLQVVALAHGNINAEQATRMSELVYQSVVAPAQVTDVARGQVMQLRRRDRLVMDINAEHPESALVSYLQAPDKTLRSRALVGLSVQILNSPFFDVLRTEKKLGYVVFANAYPVLETAALVFIVQSPVADAVNLQREVHEFLADYQQSITKMDVAEFEQHKTALVARVLEAERQLSERSSRFWQEIDRSNFDFDSREIMAQAIRDTSLEEFRTFYQRTLNDPDQRALTIRVHGTSTPLAADRSNHEQPVTASWVRSNRGYFH
jgi:insulysin